MTIDWWTLGIQTVNVLVLIWLLRRFFWSPVAAMIARRRAATQASLDEALVKDTAADTALAAIAETRAGFAKERDTILAEAHAAAERAKAASLEAATAAASAAAASAKARTDAAQSEAEEAWAAHAGRLAVEIAGRLAMRLEGPAVSAAFLDWLLRDVRALPDTARRAAAEDGAAFQAISATALDQAEQERIRDLIAQALGAHPAIVFAADPALIAGLELHGPHFTLTNSWRADLTRIEADLAHADRG